MGFYWNRHLCDKVEGAEEALWRCQRKRICSYVIDRKGLNDAFRTLVTTYTTVTVKQRVLAKLQAVQLWKLEEEFDFVYIRWFLVYLNTVALKLSYRVFPKERIFTSSGLPVMYIGYRLIDWNEWGGDLPLLLLSIKRLSQNKLEWSFCFISELSYFSSSP